MELNGKKCVIKWEVWWNLLGIKVELYGSKSGTIWEKGGVNWESM